MNAAVEPIPAEPKASPAAPILSGPLRRPEPGAKLEIRIAKSGAMVLIVAGDLQDAARDKAGLLEAVADWYDGA